MELSGGQWQQLALGRGMMRTPAAPLLLLLAEPTAALDLPLPEEAAVAWVAAGAGVGSIGAGLVQAFLRRAHLVRPDPHDHRPTVVTLWLLAMDLAGPGWTR